MLDRRHYSLSKRLTWMNLVVSGTALVLACTAFFIFDWISFRQATVRNVSTDAQIVGLNSVSALLFNDPKSAEDTLAALNVTHSVLYAGIYGPEGHFFAGYWRGDQIKQDETLPSVPAAGQTEFYRFRNGQVELVRTVVFEGKPTGIVYIRSDLSQINARLRRYLLIALVVLLISLTAALFVSRVSRRTVSDPIAKLAGVARAVSRDKNYSVRAEPARTQDEVSILIDSFNEMLAQIQERDGALQKAHHELEKRVQERTAQLTVANKELEAFSYSVSHDLRAPLRSIDGFSQALLEDCGDVLNDQGKNFLHRIRAATQRMGVLIDDLLNLARVTRAELHTEKFSLSAVADSVVSDLRKADPERRVETRLQGGLEATGDARLLRVVFVNLLGNAWKFSSKTEQARIEFGKTDFAGCPIYYVRDNGAGFDPAFADRLFGAFQRLHTAAEFPGTGVGLATVQRIIHRHGGEVWAESTVGQGATFYFTLWHPRPDQPTERKQSEGVAVLKGS